MRMANKKISLLLAFILMFCLCVQYQTFAVSLPQYIKIGLFYGSKAKSYYNVSAPGGMVFHLANDSSASEIFSFPGLTNVTVKKNTFFSTECPGSFTDYLSALSKVEELRYNGIDAYCSLSGSSYTVRIGIYKTLEEAEEKLS